MVHIVIESNTHFFAVDLMSLNAESMDVFYQMLYSDLSHLNRLLK